MKAKKVAVIVGSLRKESFNRKMANAMVGLAPDSLELEILEIDNLEFYNQDLDSMPPESWTEFRAKVSTYDAVLFFTPEYNRSVPAVLKNAIDIGSRPHGKSVWDGKPAGVVSVSIGSIGGFGANHHLRQSLCYLNMPTMPTPELYIGKAADLFNDQGILINESTREHLWKFINTFASWVELHASHVPREDWFENRPNGMRGNWLAELADI